MNEKNKFYSFIPPYLNDKLDDGDPNGIVVAEEFLRIKDSNV